jgi:hypothetical protein
MLLPLRRAGRTVTSRAVSRAAASLPNQTDPAREKGHFSVPFASGEAIDYMLKGSEPDARLGLAERYERQAEEASA